MSSCITSRTASRTRSTPSPARNAASSSDTTDSDRAIGAVLLHGEYLAVHTEDLADGPTHRWTPLRRLRQSPPRHGTLTSVVGDATSDGLSEVASRTTPVC